MIQHKNILKLNDIAVFSDDESELARSSCRKINKLLRETRGAARAMVSNASENERVWYDILRSYSKAGWITEYFWTDETSLVFYITHPEVAEPRDLNNGNNGHAPPDKILKLNELADPAQAHPPDPSQDR